MNYSMGVVLCLGLLAPGLALGQMYRCTGADGKISFSDVPCPQKPGTKQELRDAPPATAPAPSAKGAAPAYAPPRPFTADERARVVNHLRRTSQKGASQQDVSRKLADTERGCFQQGDRKSCDLLAGYRVQAFGLTPAERRLVMQNAGGLKANPQVMGKVVAEWEENCARGELKTCEFLANQRTKSAQQQQREHLEQECAKGRPAVQHRREHFCK